mmetsp:Transcript_42135/g.76217  ORF Transcript_42135/g.76217 Transcript_42135/m.76217 type:complete len:184 (-) Transcript_42135:65-616(-)
MKKCKDFSSAEVFQTFYQGFLGWNLSISNLTEPLTPPEQVFWFTMRDSSVFGIPEYFGLVSKCGDSRCKMTRDKPYVVSRPQSSSTGQEKESTALLPGHRFATSGRHLTQEEDSSLVGWLLVGYFICLIGLCAGIVALCMAGIAQSKESAQAFPPRRKHEVFPPQDLSPESLRPRGSPTAFKE